jgi:hypothetical protein
MNKSTLFTEKYMPIIVKQICYKIKLNPSQISFKTNLSIKSAQNKFCQHVLHIMRFFLRKMHHPGHALHLMRNKRQNQQSLQENCYFATVIIALCDS